MRKYSIPQRLFLAFLLISAILIGVPVCSAAEAPKHRYVVLVYDDSGSMRANDSTDWEKANYSLQSLASLLDSGDKLYVVKMSSPGSPQEISLGADRQKAIDQIRKNSPNANQNTPFETVRTATALLEKAPNNYQRWLVISSDGRFQSGKNYISTSEFTSYLDEYRNRGSNSDINMLFLAIGSQVPADLKDAWLQVVGQPVLDARNSKDIIARMNSISALITSRDPLHPQEGSLTIKYKGTHQVQLSSPFPLRRLTILHQGSSDRPLTIQKVQVNGKASALPVSGPYLAGPPVGGKEKIFGRVIHIGNGQTAIPAGTYTLTYAEDVTKERTSIKYMAETAIDFRCGLYKQSGGKWIPVTNENVLEGDQVEARVEILDTNGKPLMLADIKKLANVLVDIGDQRGIKLQADLSNNRFTARGIKLEPGRTNARFTMTLSGWYQGSKNIRLEVNSFVPRNLALTVDPPDWKCPVDKLEEAGPIILTPTVDGRPMTPDEFAQIKDNLLPMSSDLNVKVKKRQQNYELYPQNSWLGAAFTPTGEFLLKAELQGRVVGEAASADILITVDNVSWQKKFGSNLAWPPVAILLVIYLYGLYKKPRFFSRSSYMNYKREMPGKDWGSVDPKPEKLKSFLLMRYLIPFVPEARKIGHIKFVATDSPWSVTISRKSLNALLKDNETRIRLAGLQITSEDLDSDLVMGLGQELLIQRPGGQEWFHFCER